MSLPETPLEFHFIPGLWSAGARGLLERLATGATPFALRDLVRADGAPALEVPEALQWLSEPAPRESRALQGRVLLVGLGRGRVELASFGAGPDDRAVMGLRLTPDLSGTSTTLVDVEIALMGLACAALAGEDQGAVLLGVDLGPLGLGLQRGTLSEQLTGLVALQAAGLRAVILAPGTASKLELAPGWRKSRLGDLEERRPIEATWSL